MIRSYSRCLWMNSTLKCLSCTNKAIWAGTVKYSSNEWGVASLKLKTESGHHHETVGMSWHVSETTLELNSKMCLFYEYSTVVLIMSSSQTVNCVSSLVLVSQRGLGLHDQRPCCGLEMGKVAALPAQRSRGWQRRQAINISTIDPPWPEIDWLNC